MLRVKKKYINTVITKGTYTVKLTNNLDQQTLLYIQRMICNEYVEIIPTTKTK